MATPRSMTIRVAHDHPELREHILPFIREAVDLPKSVERYVKEHKDKGMEESKAWAVAWSRYCKYRNPGSPRCKQDEYFHGEGKKNASYELSDDELRAAVIRLAHERPEFRNKLVPALQATKVAVKRGDVVYLPKSINAHLTDDVVPKGSYTVTNTGPDEVTLMSRGAGQPRGYLVRKSDLEAVTRVAAKGMSWEQCLKVAASAGGPVALCRSIYKRQKGKSASMDKTAQVLAAADDLTHVGAYLLRLSHLDLSNIERDRVVKAAHKYALSRGEHEAVARGVARIALDIWQRQAKSPSAELSDYARRQFSQARDMATDSHDRALILATTVGRQAKRMGMSPSDVTKWLQGAYGDIWVRMGNLDPGADLKEVRSAMLKAMR